MRKNEMMIPIATTEMPTKIEAEVVDLIEEIEEIEDETVSTSTSQEPDSSP